MPNPEININDYIHPEHYKGGSIECIDSMVLTYGIRDTVSFCKLNAYKYIWRHLEKEPALAKVDLEKAREYINFAKRIGRLDNTIVGEELATLNYQLDKLMWLIIKCYEKLE